MQLRCVSFNVQMIIARLSF